jgi:hypothetical protein
MMLSIIRHIDDLEKEDTAQDFRGMERIDLDNLALPDDWGAY